jgi:hypothetical protein
MMTRKGQIISLYVLVKLTRTVRLVRMILLTQMATSHNITIIHSVASKSAQFISIIIYTAVLRISWIHINQPYPTQRCQIINI